MEITTFKYIPFGAIALVLWALTFLKYFKKPELYLASNIAIRTFSKIRFGFFILGVFAWMMIMFSLLLPRKPAGYTKGQVEVNDIIFVVDVSRSMLAVDFQPNRLEAAKRKILEFVELRPTDRIGIIMFSEKAFTLLPLSTDLELVKRIIEDINVGFLGMGTNIGDALALGVARGAQSLAKNKVIILLTDGVSNVGSMTPIQAAEEARAQNIKVYTIGIGSVQNRRVLKTGVGGQGGYQMIPGGSVDLKTLEAISGITGGKHFFAQDSAALSEVLAEIQKLEKTKIDKSSRIVYKELYLQYFLPGLLLLLALEFLRRSVLREAT